MRLLGCHRSSGNRGWFIYNIKSSFRAKILTLISSPRLIVLCVFVLFGFLWRFASIGLLSVLVFMLVTNSLKGLIKRDKDCKRVVRNGVVFIINKKNPRFKAKQGKKHSKSG